MAIDAQTQRGLVIAARGRRGSLETPDGTQLPYIVKGRKLRVVCGDVVEWSRDPNGELAIVNHILNRDNELERKPPGQADTIEVLAANLSHLVVVCASVPDPDWFLIDRYICAGELMRCEVSIIANKSDLDSASAVDLSEYRALGYDCLTTSAKTGAGLDALQARLVDATAVLVGQSGVGKSSLVNALCPGADYAVATVSEATAEGKHTTTASTMRRLPNGAKLIDTPGVREFVPAFHEASTVATGFREISRASAQCRFANCQHLREPDCAVKTAVANGEIVTRRYDSYKRVINSI